MAKYLNELGLKTLWNHIKTKYVHDIVAETDSQSITDKYTTIGTLLADNRKGLIQGSTAYMMFNMQYADATKPGILRPADFKKFNDSATGNYVTDVSYAIADGKLKQTINGTSSNIATFKFAKTTGNVLNITVGKGDTAGTTYSVPTTDLFSTALKYEPVDELPSTPATIKENTIYLVRDKSSAAENNNCIEYMYVNNAWEIIGDTRVAIEVIEDSTINALD